MRSSRAVAPALVLGALLLWYVAPLGASQGGSGHLRVDVDYELFGFGDLRGGGHVTWTLTGEVARGLRARVLGLYDGYVQIPRGFPHEGAATRGDLNGVIDADEGLVFTDFLENELEGYGRGLTGTDIGYFRLDRADLLEKGVANALERSSSGFVGSDLNSTSDLVIRFLFNGYSTSPDASMPLSTRFFGDALYALFAMHQEQTAGLVSVGGYPPAWPLTEEGGWHIVTADDGRSALWAGNDTTGMYPNGTAALSRTVSDPIRSIVPEDLRFATTAWLNFTYTGQAPAGDRLRVEAATAPAFASWVPLQQDGSPDVPTTSVGTWQNLAYDLSAFLGQQVRFRLNFTSDGTGSARGFFVRGFGIHAPSAARGTILESTSHFLIGTLSFSDVAAPTGGLTLVRTPGGEILFYSSTWNATALPPDALRFQTFNAFENPQVLFVVMLAAAYVINRGQDTAFERFRKAHPSEYRPEVEKARWLHLSGRIAMLLLVLLYFVPSAFFFLGVRLLVSGPVYLFLALSLALGFGFGTRAYYDQVLEAAPPTEPEAVPETPREEPEGGPRERAPPAHCTHCLREIPDADRVYRCSCGAAYHVSCAAGLMRCANCRKPVTVEVVAKKRALSMRCESCGEVQTVEEGADPRTVACSACGGRLRHLDAGKGYLLLASNPALAFAWLRDLSKGGKPAVCLTPANPERLRLEFSLKGVDVLHVSADPPKGINPKRLDPDALRAILPLFKEKKGGVLLYDGLEQIVAMATVGDVLSFLRKANDMAFVHGVTVVARVSPGALTEDELRRLSGEFDETLDLSARL